MYIRVHAVAGSRRESVKQESPGVYAVTVREPAERNLANTRIRELLAEELKVPVGAVRIINGHHSPTKLFSIL